MKTTMIWTLALLIAAPAAAEDAPLNADVTKAVRAVVASTKKKDIEKYRKELFARSDLDWPSFKEGLMLGGYYRKPIVTDMGVRHSGKHFGIRLTGADGKARGFSMYLPKGYTAVDKIPVLVYLHHQAWAPVESGTSKSEIAIRKFREVCEDRGILFVAPYTGSGAEWWTEEGVKLVRWSIHQVMKRYNVDEDRIGLVGALDGAEASWLVAQRMPGMFNVLMPMTGDPYEMTALIRPIYLGTLDRMDMLVGVPGKLRSERFGDKNVNAYLDGLKPLFDKGIRLTLSVQMGSNSDFHYLERIKGEIGEFVLDKEHKRKPLADEVDIETDGPDALRSMWLEVKGYDADVKPPRNNFPSTRLVWKAPARKEPGKKMGLGLQDRNNWPMGKAITAVNLGAKQAKLTQGDILVKVEGTIVKKGTNLGELLKGKSWGDEIEVVLARFVDERGLESMQRQQRQYLQIRRKVAELRAAGKPIPADRSELIEDEDESANDEDDEEEDDDDSSIEVSDGPGEDPDEDDDAGDGARKNRKKRSWFVFKRWIPLTRPEGVLIRQDFGTNWDRNFSKEGVRVRSVIPGSLADRSGFKAGDVITQVLGESIKKMADLRKAFDSYKFEKAPEEERKVTFDVNRPSAHGQSSEESLTVRWAPIGSYRVDAKWKKQDKRLDILVRHAKEATVYLTDEFVKPGEAFYVYINGVPYHDLIDPASRPDYPQFRHGMDRGRLDRMRKKRAKIENGWKPDFKFALQDQLDNPDRSCVVGGKLHLDFSKMKEGFEKARVHVRKPEGDQGKKLEAAVSKFGEAAPG